MPRPPRCRRICGAPQVDTFCPNGCENTEPILLTLDEYEVIRLVDLEQQTHEQCAAQMDISRSTVQEIYESARRKIAACLVHGKPLHITGGNYRICGGQEAAHCGRCCRMQRANTEKSNKKCEGDSIMKIAVTYENGQIFQHIIQPNAHAAAITLAKRMSNIHLHILFHDLVEAALGHGVQMLQSLPQVHQGSKAKVTLSNIHITNLSRKAIDIVKKILMNESQCRKFPGR